VFLPHIVVSGVRVGSGNDDHAKLSAPSDKLTKRVGILQPCAAVVERDFSWVIRDTTTCA